MGEAVAADQPFVGRGQPRSDVSKEAVERPRHSSQIQRVDEQSRGLDLPAAVGSEKATKLLLGGPCPPCGLPLEGAERLQVALSGEDIFHRGGAEGADQLVLEVCGAHEEPERFQIGASQVRAKAGPLERLLEVTFLCGVTEARQPEVEPPRSEPIQEASDGVRTSDRDNGNALGAKIPATTFGERLDREPVTGPFDQDDRTHGAVESRRGPHWSILMVALASRSM